MGGGMRGAVAASAMAIGLTGCVADGDPSRVPRRGPELAPALDPDEVCRAIDDAFAFADQRLRAAARFVQQQHPNDPFTHYPTNTFTRGDQLGQWNLTPRPSRTVGSRVEDWRSGYFPGALWQLYAYTRAPDLLPLAKGWTDPIAALRDTPIDHDNGARFLRSFGDALRVLGDADDPGGAYRQTARDTLIAAALSLDQRFDMGGIPAGALRGLDDYPPGPYPSYVDSMKNIALLLEAWSLAGRPAAGRMRTLYDHAVTHAATVMRDHVRPNGSTYHIVQYGDGTHGTAPDGAVHAKLTLQGYGDETTWSRGQAWALYGFAEVYAYTRDDAAAEPRRFLATAEKVADTFVASLPANVTADPSNHRANDFVPPTDFDAALGEPAGPFNDANDDGVRGDRKPPLRTFTARDTSAAAVAASGLLRLAELASTGERRDAYFRSGTQILIALLTFRRADGKLAYLARDSVHQGVLAQGSAEWNAPEQSLIYGDYFLLEAMHRHGARAAGGCPVKRNEVEKP